MPQHTNPTSSRSTPRRAVAALPAFETLCPQSGLGSFDGDPLVTPIVQSTTFCRDGLQSHAPHAYSRESNPTVFALEKALGDLEQAPPALAFSTGLAAETALFQTLLSAGDHVVCSQAVYGGTTRLLEQILHRFGVRVTFVDTRCPDSVRAAVQANTKLIFVETPANPTLDITDLRAVGEIAKAAGAWFAVDNTFLTPVLQQPLDLGADFSVYSTTKFLEGHSVALGGAIVSRDREALERIHFLRKCTGAIQTPWNAWLTLLGIKTLAVRLQRQSQTAFQLAQRLADHPAVSRVLYPGLPGFPGADVARTQHLGHHGAVLAFDLHAGEEATRELLGRVQLCRVVEHVGSTETLLTHSASMTHAGVSPEHRARVGITDSLVRISVGLEHPADLWDDLGDALDSLAKADLVTSNTAEVAP